MMFARRGQCFSTTKYVAKIDSSDIKMISDILKPKKDDKDAEPGETYNFTDGCGNIS